MSSQRSARQTFGSTREPEREEKKALLSGWRRWVLGLAGVGALVAILVARVLNKLSAPVNQVAMLDLSGTTRGTVTPEVETLKQTWKESHVESFSSTGGLDAWEKNWPEGGKTPVVKVLYDRSAGEVRVAGRFGEKRFQKTFPVGPDVQAALKQAVSFIAQQTGR